MREREKCELLTQGATGGKMGCSLNSKFLNLWEIMNVFQSSTFLSTIQGIQDWQNRLDKARSSGEAPTLSDDVIEAVSRLLGDASDVCTETGMAMSSIQVTHICHNLMTRQKDCNYSTLSSDLRNIQSLMMIEIWRRKFIQVAVEHSEYLNNDKLCGVQVAVAFPSAKFDLAEAGNCLAADLNTAAVFHLMRAVECGLRVFAAHLGFREVVVNSKRQKTVPIEYAEWERILNQLPEKIDSKIEAMARGPEKQQAQQFYYGALQEVGAFKEAWRNHVMHTRESYTSEDAIAVLSHVERFMKSLAEYGIKDTQPEEVISPY